MKIVQVCPRFFPHIGGVETHVYEISKRLSKKHEVCVYTTDPSRKLPKVELIDGIEVKRFRSFAPNESYFFSPSLYSTLKKESYDIIHAHLYHAFPAIEALFARSNGAKFIFNPYFHGRSHTSFRNILFNFYHLIGKRIFQESDVIVCSSEYEREILENFFTFKEIEIIPLGIDFSKFTKNIKRKQRIKTILYVGRLEKYKGIDHLVKAMHLLRKDHDVNLKIIGGGPYRRDLEYLVKKLNLTNNVTFLGRKGMAEMADLYSKAEVLVSPSLHESFGLVLIEALKSGLAVLSTPVGEAPFLIRNNMILELKIPPDSVDIANKLKNLIDNKTILNNGINNKLLHRYSYDSISKKIEAIYLR